MLKTLAAKHQSTVTKMAARHKAKVITGDGPRTCFEARRQREGKKDLVARFGGIPLKRDRRAVITDPAPVPVITPRKELIHRLRRRWCELCEHGATVAVHQVARLARLGKPGPGQPAWAALMATNAAQDPHRLRVPATSTSTRTPSRTRHSHWRARCIERCPPGSEGGCAEKARTRQCEHGTSPRSPSGCSAWTLGHPAAAGRHPPARTQPSPKTPPSPRTHRRPRPGLGAGRWPG